MRLYHIFEAESKEHRLHARMRAFIFQHLDESLLFTTSFGLEDKNLGMEQELRNFESSFSEDHPGICVHTYLSLDVLF